MEWNVDEEINNLFENTFTFSVQLQGFQKSRSCDISFFANISNERRKLRLNRNIFTLTQLN